MTIKVLHTVSCREYICLLDSRNPLSLFCVFDIISETRAEQSVITNGHGHHCYSLPLLLM